MAKLKLKKLEYNNSNEIEPILVEMANKALEAKYDTSGNLITDTYATKLEVGTKLDKVLTLGTEVYAHDGANQITLSIDNTAGGTPLSNSLITSRAVYEGLAQKISDVRIDGLSVASNNIANIELGQGLSYSDGLGVSLTSLPETVPKTRTLEQQKNMTIMIEDDGILSKSSLNNLDYTKLKVVNQEDLSIINTNDFLFIKED